MQQGRYAAEVIAARVTQSGKGTGGIALEFHTEGGDIDEVLWVTPKTRERVIETMETLGVSRQQLDDKATLERLSSLVVGARCEIVVELEMYNGEAKMRVKWINPLAPEAADDTVGRLHEILTGKSKARAAPRGIDDHVPF
jgi:hypothetical protein